MASSSSSNSNSIVSQEEFNTFHNIDRMLYTRLVVNLERHPEESMQVMGFWIWLERAGHVRHFVEKMLPFPDSFINSVAEETLLCLKCTQIEYFIHLPDIPLLHKMSDTTLSLRFIHENRLNIVPSVSIIVNEVCSRAFQDILAQVETLKANNSHNVLPFVYNKEGHFGNFTHGDYNIALGEHILSKDVGDKLSRIQICTDGEDEKDGSSSRVPADDRTIFLTFSKGYHIVEEEIRKFFSRKYGECIEAIYMQEVPTKEHQSLYARLVVPSPAIMKMILGRNSKVKFSINRKNAWARKYVRRN